jgi:hypothetical protein
VPLHPGLCNGGGHGGDHGGGHGGDHGGGYGGGDQHLNGLAGGGGSPPINGYSPGGPAPSNSYGTTVTDSYGAPVAVPYGGGTPSGPEAAYGDGLAASVLLDGIAGYPLRPQQGPSGYADSYGVGLQGMHLQIKVLFLAA